MIAIELWSDLEPKWESSRVGDWWIVVGDWWSGMVRVNRSENMGISGQYGE